ncbi:hypothetical protein, partial [Sporisorium scitamineum]
QQQYPPNNGYSGYPPSMPQQQDYPQHNGSYYSPQQQQAQASPGTPSQPPLQQQSQGGQANQVDKATDPQGWALAEYGSPYAHSKDWRASPSDLELTGFPEQKLTLRVKQRFSRSP